MRNEQYGQTQGSQLLEMILKEVGPIFSIDEVRSLAIDQGMTSQDLRRTLHSLSRSGWIERIKRGTYAAASSIYSEEMHPFALADALVKPMAISHWSALSHYGLTTQIPPMVQATTPKKIVTPEMREGKALRPRGRAVWKVMDVEVEFIYIEKKRFFGFQREWVSRWHQISITDRERTMLDMVARPDLFGGIELSIETFQEHGHAFDHAKLVRYALRYDMGSVIKRLGWILEEMGVSPNLLKPLQEFRVQSYYPLEPDAHRTGTYNSRWHIIQNIGAEKVLEDN